MRSVTPTMRTFALISALLVSALSDNGLAALATSTSPTTLTVTTEAHLGDATFAGNQSQDANSTGLEDVEGRARAPVGTGVSRGCRSFQGAVGRCVTYAECGVSFENEFFARSSLCGFSNRRPLVCCPHDTFSSGISGFQFFPPGFQQNFFQQDVFANSFFYTPAQSFYQHPSYSSSAFEFQQPPLFGLNNGYGAPGAAGGFYNDYGGYLPTKFVRPQPTFQPTYVAKPPVRNTKPFGLPNLRPPIRSDVAGGGASIAGDGGSINNGNNDGSENVPPQRDAIFNSQYCGLSNATTRRIVGGREAAVGAWPWLALLFVDVTGNGYKAPLCGGALINPNHVLTAAHCVNLMGNVLPESRLTVRLGEHDYLATDDGASPVDIEVRKIFSNPNFNNRTYFNDIAILRLRRSVPFGHGVAPICVPDTAGNDSEYKGRSASVAGWGELYYAGPASSILQETTIPIQSLDTCKDAFKRTVIRFNENYLCAGSLKGDRDTCRGDSGGPLMLLNDRGRYTVIGVTSFGRRCAEKGYPGSYTRVAKYIDWMRNVLTSP